jgi:hypothetical protein
MLESFLLRLHLLNFAADASDFLLDGQDVADLASALEENGLEALLGFAGILEASDEVGMLLKSLATRERETVRAIMGVEGSKPGAGSTGDASPSSASTEAEVRVYSLVAWSPLTVFANEPSSGVWIALLVVPLCSLMALRY